MLWRGRTVTRCIKSHEARMFLSSLDRLQPACPDLRSIPARERNKDRGAPLDSSSAEPPLTTADLMGRVDGDRSLPEELVELLEADRD
jgi:hypothetical protein